MAESGAGQPYYPFYHTPEDTYQGPLIEAAAINAYRHYGDAVGGTTWDGKPIPEWQDIKGRQRNGWRAAVSGALISWLHARSVELSAIPRELKELATSGGAAEYKGPDAG